MLNRKLFAAGLSALVLAFVVLVLNDSAAGQTRVQFPKGRTTAVLKGKTRGNAEEGNEDFVRYKLRAREGQRMIVRLVTPGKRARFLIYLPDSDYLTEGTDWEGPLPQTGDYEIWVHPTGSRDTAFTLEITIR